MRDYAQNLKWILVFVILSFLISFVLTFQAGLGSYFDGRRGVTWAAKVGRHEVTIKEFQQAMSRTEDRYRQILGANYNAKLLDPRSVLDDLIDQNVLLEEADRLGVVASDEEVARTIRGFGMFKNDQGKFDRELYDDYLSRASQTAASFELQVADDIRTGAMSDMLSSGIVPSRLAVEQEWRRENESASIDYVVLPLEPHLTDVAPTDADLHAYYDAHVADFDAGAARQVRLVRFSRDEAQKKLENEADMRTYYNENVGAIYTMSEDQRRASVVVVSVPPGASDAGKAAARTRAESVAARARAGEDFAALAREISDDEVTKQAGGDMGPFYQGMQEPTVDQALFAAAEGDVVGPLETLRGFEVFKLTKGTGTKARAFEEVRNLVSRGLYATAASEALAKEVKSFQEAVAAAKDLDAAAAAAGVSAGEPMWITEAGEIPGMGKNPIVSTKAFELDVDSISEPLADVGGQVVVQVLAKRDSSPQTFDEARAAVETAVRRDLARGKARVEAQALLDAAKSAGDLAGAAGGRTVQTASQIKKGRRVGDLEAPELNLAAFEVEAGQFGPVVDVPDGAAVFRVTARVGYDEAKFEAERDDIAKRLRSQQVSALRQAALGHLREKYKRRIRTNEDFLAQVSGG
jgi:peptidyl-prolyl cis-trans isomerase D